MSKIYRLHSGASDAVQDWTQIDGYLDAVHINNIKDTAGANARNQITSIPSPFARIDLVKTAFKNVTASAEPEGISIFHKMVSDALDVGQVFFNSARLKDKVDIIAWNPGLKWVGGQPVIDEHSDLWQLIHSGSAGHRLYGETLKMFLSQDAMEYNFDAMQQFYLLHYKEGPGRFNIIGGTSPATLFFPAANKLDYVSIRFRNDKLFDDTYCPLYERSEDYVLFLYALREAMPGFKVRFSVMDDYLELCLKRLPARVKEKVLALNAGSYESMYAGISLAGTGGLPEILGHELRGLKINHEKPQEESDFVIAATQPVSGLKPLVLPSYTFKAGLNYVDGPWPAQLKAPYYDPLPLQERILPGQEIKYPYLVTGDFLEPYLIRLPFEPDQDRFFSGYIDKGSNEGYLLPLSPAFFTYFSSADLRGRLPDGRRMFEFEKMPGNAVKARLIVPVKNGRYIEMERLYTAPATHTAEPDITRNQGIIKELQFSLAIYPFVKRGSDLHASYTVMLLVHDAPSSPSAPYILNYYKDNAPRQEIKPKTRRQKSNRQRDLVDTIYDVVPVEFDYIMLASGKARGCLLPLFAVAAQHNRKYAFSVDFGTTNTHIEYSVDGSLPQPFDISADDQQLGMLHKWDDKTYNHLAAARFGMGATFLLENVPKELMPERVGGKAKHRFPHRTVVSEPLNVDLNSETYPLADFSIYWQYDEGTLARQLRFHTNLKWGSLNDDRLGTERRVSGYIANLVLLMRNKVLLNGGDLSQASIVWFYPTSMSGARLHTFENIWHKQIERYMGTEVKVSALPESIAPYYFFRHENGVKAGDQPVINIDIGGGTTDIVVYRNEQITSYTSFKFAGNAVFGDGYGNPPVANGFVQFFERRYRNILKDTPLAKYIPPAGSVQRSDDFITTLFGLQHHPDRGEQYFSFTEEIRESGELKVVPLLFLSSIFYHVAKCQKAQGDTAPRFITFSGTASKILHILDASRGLKGVTRLANLIFNDVLGTQGANIELVMAKGPKEVTAKGGLYNPVVPDAPKFVLFGTEEKLGSGELLYKDALEERTRNAVIEEVSSFIDRFFEWNSKADFAQEFGLHTGRLPELKKIMKTDLDIFLVEGIYELKEEMNKQEDNELRETLFFMPLKGVLNKLAFHIIDNS